MFVNLALASLALSTVALATPVGLPGAPVPSGFPGASVPSGLPGAPVPGTKRAMLDTPFMGVSMDVAMSGGEELNPFADALRANADMGASATMSAATGGITSPADAYRGALPNLPHVPTMNANSTVAMSAGDRGTTPSADVQRGALPNVRQGGGANADMGATATMSAGGTTPSAGAHRGASVPNFPHVHSQANPTENTNSTVAMSAGDRAITPPTDVQRGGLPNLPPANMGANATMSAAEGGFTPPADAHRGALPNLRLPHADMGATATMSAAEGGITTPADAHRGAFVPNVPHIPSQNSTVAMSGDRLSQADQAGADANNCARI